MICCSLNRLFLIVDLLADRLTYQLEEIPGSRSGGIHAAPKKMHLQTFVLSRLSFADR
jgi:hypothetical protein